MIQKIAVYGSGTIGACQATLTSGNGYQTVVMGHSEKGLERCRKTMEQNWLDLIEKGLATEENMHAAMNLVTITNDPEQMRGCGFVFEAAAEQIEVKEAVYRTITEYCGNNVIVASTTSSIDAERLAERIECPERFLIAHPFQPVHMLPLVEVVQHKATDPAVVRETVELLEDMSRQVVFLKKSVPGFLVNRFAQALFRESIYLIESGVTTAEDIDKAVKYAVGMRYASIGLLEYYDAVGFELEEAIARNVYPDLCDTKEIQETTLNGLKTGKTGQKVGEGLYDWREKDDNDFRVRLQAPYFDGVKLWHMPGQ